MQAVEKNLMDNVWQYPLFEALARRRVHRFGLGYDLKDVLFPYKSEKTPVPLSELETALLCWAGHGVNGLSLGDLDVLLNTMLSWSGRTHSNPCNDQHVDLMFNNDEGTFLYRPRGATKMIEVETREEREKILTIFKEDTVKIGDGRLDLPPASMLSANVWDTNRPGQTVFFPVVNVTYEYINFLLTRFGDRRIPIIDDRTGKPAGIQKWIDNGFLNGPPMTMRIFENWVMNAIAANSFFIVQNINLACASMGLGCIVYTGILPLVVMGGTPLTKGLGFRFVTGKDGMPTAVGKDGYIEGLCPPYVNMDQAVDRVMDLKFGLGGLFSMDYSGKVPWWDRNIPTKVSKGSEEEVACTKAYCKYVYETYRRFPASVDAIQIPVTASVHHIDIDFYDKYYPKEAVSQEHRNHMKVWHEGE
jgi:nitroreductase